MCYGNDRSTHWTFLWSKFEKNARRTIEYKSFNAIIVNQPMS